MKFRVLPAAQDDLNHIDDWVFSNFGNEAAERAVERIYKVFDLLAEFPNLCVLRPEITERHVRFFALPPNLIIYAPGKPILIHRVFPARTDIRSLAI